MSDKEIIKVKFIDNTIKVKFTKGIKGDCGNSGSAGPTGPTGPTGAAGPTDHSLLTNLDYENAGHTGFQKQLVYDSEIGTYIVES